MNDNITDRLDSWDKISGEADWSSILIGNGFSQNVWSRFGYSSLYEEAQKSEHETLSDDDIMLFERFETTNFERVLSALSISISVAEALGQERAVLEERYNSIQRALISSVHSVHIPFDLMADEQLDAIKNEMLRYEAVYLINYDLICYWSLMRDPDEFRDFFFSPPQFDISNTEVWGKKTRIHFLHGGLHLYRKPTGQTLKRSARFGRNLLDLFGEEFNGSVPLFISEGSSEDKLTSIYRSDYLSFLFSEFSRDRAPIVVFGSSLGETDQHIVDVLNSEPQRPIAVSIRNDGDIRQKKASLIEALPGAKLYFFDAETHPLGSHDLEVREEGE